MLVPSGRYRSESHSSLSIRGQPLVVRRLRADPTANRLGLREMIVETQLNVNGAGLRRLVHEVRELGFGERTDYASGCLTVSYQAACALVADPALAEVRLACAAPGDSVRIVGALDAVQPCSKAAGGGGVFPGFLGASLPPGRGETHVLRGAAVLAAGYLPRAQEAVIDMFGPAAPLSPLAFTHNLVIEFERAPEAAWEDVEAAVRRGILRVAVHLADARGRRGARASGSSPTCRLRASSRTCSCTGAACPAGCQR